MKLLKHPFVLLFFIVCIAFFIRTLQLKDNILFGYDQARDAQRIYNMVYKGDLKIVGPETDIQGIFNGPLLYYALAPVYYFSNFDPNAAALLFVFINVGTILLIYWASKILFNKNSIALIASLLWAFSYEQGFFSRYISNASPMSTTTTIFFIGLALFFLKKKQWGLPLSAAGIALAIHCNFYFIYLFLFYPLFFLFFKPKIQIKTVAFTLGVLGILLSPWIVTELRWKFIGTKSLLTYFLHQGTTAASTNPFSFLLSIASRYYERISQGIFFSFIPSKVVGFFIATILLIYLIFKRRTPSIIFLVVWVLNTLPLFAFKSGVHGVEVINGSVFVPLTILIAVGIEECKRIKIFKMSPIPLLCVAGIVLYGLVCYTKNTFIPNSIHTGASSTLKNEKLIIDYTYKASGEKPFSICSISEPLFINTIWSFLYSTYGKQKYGYVPFWSGQRQILNESFLPYAQKKLSIKYIIEEPLIGIPDYAPLATYFMEDTQNNLISKTKFGEIRVQKRVFVKENTGNYKNIYTQNQVDKYKSLLNVEPRFSCDISYE